MEEEIKKDLMEEEVQEENTDAVETDAVKTDETMSEDTATDTAAEAENEPVEEAADSDEEEDSDKKDETADTDGRNKKDGFFKKKKDKEDEQIEDMQDRRKRQMDELDNFRKRAEKEKSQMFDMGARTIIEKILPVVDNFERGLAAVPEDQKEDAFVTGMDKVYKQLMTELEAIGVKPIETEGKEFDPELHNAVMQVENEELEAGTIAQELQKGYYYKDTVVRHSMVSVVS